MNAELIVAALLNHPAVNAITTRKSLGQLPQNTAYPAIVYQTVTATPDPNLAANKQESQRATVRVQINPIAKSIPELKALQGAIRQAMDWVHDTDVAGKRVTSCRFSGYGPTSKDNDAGVWTVPSDFILQFYE